MTARYALYGLNIASDFDLDLPAAAPGSIDIHIRRAGNNPPGRRLNAPMGEAWLDPATATVHFRPAPHADGEAIRLYILNALLLEMLPLLGYVCLHGSAAAHNGQTLAVLAPQGTGKSTFIATLLGMGWQLLSDDLLIIEPASLAIQPGVPQIRLWQDSIERLGWQDRPRCPDRYRPGKFSLDFPVAGKAQVPTAIVSLQRGQGELERLEASRAFFALLKNSFPMKFQESRSEILRFKVLGTLSRHIPIYRQGLTSHVEENVQRALTKLGFLPESLGVI